MSTLDVGINPSKSLVSDLGMFEFAKRLGSFTHILSGLSLKSFSRMSQAWPMLIEVVSKLKVSRSAFLRFLNVGSFAAGHTVPRFSEWTGRACMHRVWELMTNGNLPYIPFSR